MFRIRADHHDATLALDDLAFFAHRLNGRLYLHCNTSLNSLLFRAPSDAALGQIIGRHLQCYLIARQDPDEIHPQLAGDMSQ